MNTFFSLLLPLILSATIVSLFLFVIRQRISQSTFGWLLVPCLLLLVVSMKFDFIREVDFKGLKLIMKELETKKKEATETISSANQATQLAKDAANDIYLSLAQSYLHMALEDRLFVGDEYAEDEMEKKVRAIAYLRKASANLSDYQSQFDQIDGKIALVLASSIMDSLYILSQNEAPAISRPDAISAKQEFDRALFKEKNPDVIVNKLDQVLNKYKVDHKLIEPKLTELRSFVSKRKF